MKNVVVIISITEESDIYNLDCICVDSPMNVIAYHEDNKEVEIPQVLKKALEISKFDEFDVMLAINEKYILPALTTLYPDFNPILILNR